MNSYKKLSSEWGSKARKADSRAAKKNLRKPSKEDLEEVLDIGSELLYIPSTSQQTGDDHGLGHR